MHYANLICVADVISRVMIHNIVSQLLMLLSNRVSGFPGLFC